MPPSDAPAEAADLAALPLYNTSFTLFHCSPLHLPRNTSIEDFRKTFPSHTRRFADHLQREARLGLSILGALDDSDALARAGPLKQTTWTWEGPDPDSHDALEGPDGFGLTEGLRIVVEFERSTYAALFLRRRSDVASAPDDAEHHRLRLPLLFFRMPTTLRGALLSYIAAHFDARADPVHMPGPRMALALEEYLATIAPELQRGSVGAGAGAGSDSDSDADARSGAIKDVQLTLAFPDPALRNLDVAVPGKDVTHFIKLGAQTPKVKANGNAKGTANGTRTAARKNGTAERAELDAGPFTRALAAYLHTHLALDMAHRDVRLARIACGGWAIAREGRVKIFAPKSVDRDVGEEIMKKLLECLLEWKAQDGDEDVVMMG